MRKILTIIILLLSAFIMSACNNNSSNQQTEEITGNVTLPVAVSLDSSDGVTQFPYEVEDQSIQISWSSSDSTIASIDNEGYVTIHKEGKVEITATSGTHISSSDLFVTVDKYTDYIRINTKAEFLMYFTNPINFNSPNKKYVLTKDIDFGGDTIDPIGGWDVSTDEESIDPNTAFRATLDGRGYALMNFTINNPLNTKTDGSYFGVSLIPFMYDGVVRNLNIINANFSGTGFTGSIAGKILYGVIENCFVQGTITSTSGNMGIPAGGIAGIVGPDAIIRNVIIDVKVNGGYIYTGFNFGTGTNCNAISETLDDSERRRPMKNTADSTLKGNDDEDAALNDFLDSARIENDQLGDFDSYTLTETAKQNIWTITEGYMPFLIRMDGMTPDWAMIGEVNET